jgi:hypothetical protein
MEKYQPGLQTELLFPSENLHHSRGVTVEEMREAPIALMQLVPTKTCRWTQEWGRQ